MLQENTISDIVSHYIKDKQLLSTHATVIVGFSGGADSVALLHLLHKSGYKCIAAHCNFSLRGEESIRDYQFAELAARKFQIPFRSITFDTEQYASEKKLSIEMACRELRYNWFESIRQKEQAEAIAVAHHRDDSIETLLLNLVRGTGISGLTGIKSRNGNIIRPLLSIGKEDILHYIESAKLDYVTDSTNLESLYTRNKIRLEIIPVLKAINPSYANCIARTIENLQQTESVYFNTIISQINKLVKEIDGKHYLSVKELSALSYQETFLYEWLKQYGFSAPVCQEIFLSVKNNVSGKNFYSEQYRVVKDRNHIILSLTKDSKPENYIKIDKNTEQIVSPIHLTFEYVENNTSFRITPDKNIAYFDADKLSYPLIIRHWKQGDCFTPFGLNGSKKLSDYFSDHKYSLIEKENAFLLCSGNEIIWLVGERSSNKFRITENTQKILIVKKY